MRKILFALMIGVLPLSAHAYTWLIEGHVSGIDGSKMPTYFTFQMDADSGDGNCYAQETIKYDGSYSGTTASSNTRVMYSQVLAALLAGKLVRVSGDGGHYAGTDCLGATISTYSQTE